MRLLPEKKPVAPVSLLRLIWGSYLMSALMPLLLIELALIAAYLLAHGIIRDKNMARLRQLATQQLSYTAQQQADHISQQLASVARNTDLLRRHTALALETPFTPDEEERSRYAMTQDGALYTTYGRPGRAALIYSNLTRIGSHEREKALRLSQLDPLLANLVDTEPLVVQAFVNTPDHLSRIYPYLDVLLYFGTDFDTTGFNFYYDADAEHNPERRVVWTDMYTDPAGKGWMASAIAPVYSADGSRLEAVVGLDVTADVFREQVLQLRLPWDGYGMLIDGSGTILVMPQVAEGDWGMKELTSHPYEKFVRKDNLKPPSFKLHFRPGSQMLGQRMLSEQQGQDTVLLAERSKQVAWSTVSGTNWKLLVVVDEADIFAEAQVLNAFVLKVGVGMIAALVLFYVLFLGWLYRRVRRMSLVLATPLLDLEAMMQRISQNEYLQRTPVFSVVELQRTGEGLVRMGQVLGESNQSLRQARKELEQLNQELEERIRRRTCELEAANAALQQENAARQSLIQQLQRTQNQLIQSEKLASLGQLTAGIAHEIKNPLNFITNLSEVNIELAQELVGRLRAQPPLRPDELQDLVEDLKQNSAIVHQHGMRADHIIRSMMEHARSRPEAFQPTEVVPLVEEYVRLTYHGERARCPELQVTFVKELDPAVGTAQVAPQELGRVIQNLLHNSIYAVTLKQRELAGGYVPTITVRAHREGSDILIQVEDNGTGIPDEVQDHIFEPFFTTKPPGAGNTGLGLSLSYDIIVKLHGGSLVVESEMGCFTCFTLRIPAGGPPQEAALAS